MKVNQSTQKHSKDYYLKQIIKEEKEQQCAWRKPSLIHDPSTSLPCLASNKNKLWNAVEKMVERCWNFPKNFWNERAKNSIGFYRNVSLRDFSFWESFSIHYDAEIHIMLKNIIFFLIMRFVLIWLFDIISFYIISFCYVYWSVRFELPQPTPLCQYLLPNFTKQIIFCKIPNFLLTKPLGCASGSTLSIYKPLNLYI